MKKTVLFLVAALSICGLAACGNKAAQETNEAQEAQPQVAVVEAKAGDVIDLKDDNAFRPDTKVTVPTVLDFNAVWCIPCKKLTPAFHQVAKDFAGKVEFYSVDIDSLPQTKDAFEIQGVPTVIILTPNGKTERHLGLGDFIPSDTPQDINDEQLTEVISSSLKAMIENAVAAPAQAQ